MPKNVNSLSNFQGHVLQIPVRVEGHVDQHPATIITAIVTRGIQGTIVSLDQAQVLITNVASIPTFDTDSFTFPTHVITGF